MEAVLTNFYLVGMASTPSHSRQWPGTAINVAEGSLRFCAVTGFSFRPFLFSTRRASQGPHGSGPYQFLFGRDGFHAVPLSPVAWNGDKRCRGKPSVLRSHWIFIPPVSL